MDRATFERFVESELDALPERYAARLENVHVVIEDEPSDETLVSLGYDPRHDTLFGLYEGTPLGERSLDGFSMPDRITLYYRPLSRSFRTHSRIRREIRKTIIHEVAHFFGMDDEEIEDLGY